MTKKTLWTRVQMILGVAVVIAGVAMLVAAFVVPPTGEIHSSVLVAYGETLTFGGALLGLDAHYKAKYTKNESERKD